jgi:very-short-patch-repair endonuclease
VKSRLTNVARALRHDQTDAERKLWSVLRNRQLEGLKFRRQQPMGDYIADFCCEEIRLILNSMADSTQRKRNTIAFELLNLRI